MQLIVLFRAFRVFASWAKDAHPCLTHFVDELPFLGLMMRSLKHDGRAPDMPIALNF